MGDEIKKKYLDLVRNNECHSSFEQMNKYGLQMFYTAGLDNVFYADDIEKAIAVLDMGVDTILTNDYLKISNAVKEHLKK
jgi:hypothetical protein